MKKKTRIILFLAAVVLLSLGYLLPKEKAETTLVETEPPTAQHAPLESGAVTEVEAPVVEESPLRKELAKAMGELPTATALSELDSEELHHTPEIILKGGLLVGELLEKAENEPARREETLKFLKSCAENPEVAHQIRAVCWRKTLAQIPEWKLFLPIADADVPDDIKELAIKLP